MSKVSSQPPVSKEPAPKPVERKRPVQTERDADGIRIHIPRRAYIILYSVLAVPALIALGIFIGRAHSTRETKSQPESLASGLQPAVPTTRNYLNPGPWGTVEYVPFELSIPEEFLSVRIDEKSDRRWFFRGYNADTLKTFFQQQQLSDAQRQQILMLSWL